MSELTHVTVDFVARTVEAARDIEAALIDYGMEWLYDFLHTHPDVEYLGVNTDEWSAEDPFEEAQ